MTAWYEAVPEWTSPAILTSFPPRPAFDVVQRPEDVSAQPALTLAEANLPLPSSNGNKLSWRNEVTCSAYTEHSAWMDVMMELVKFPERTSTNILRADVLLEEDHPRQDSQTGWRLTKSVLREILPRRPGVNASLIELCSFFEAVADDGQSLLVTYTPLIVEGSTSVHDVRTIKEVLDRSRSPADSAEVPFYHPAVLSLAFTYRPNAHSVPAACGQLAIHMLPFPCNVGSPTLTRVATSLLKTIHIHTWGKAHDYRARVNHDRLVPRDLFQDVYLNLKFRWAAYLCTQWKEKTDPEKHVHEDLAVCAWLMIFWRCRFGQAPMATSNEKIDLRSRPWLDDSHSWARPRGGFVDVGCGNGLLVWLLNNEGYKGHGFDLRPRKSWELFDHEATIQVEYSAPKTERGHASTSEQVSIRKADLRVHSLDAVRTIHDHLHGVDEGQGASEQHLSLFPPGCFLIGNHADELTPHLPLLALTVSGCSGLLNIPCCPWMVSGDRFTRTNYRVSRHEVASLLRVRLESDSSEDQKHALHKEMHELSLGPPIDAPQPATPSAKGNTDRGGSKMIAYLTYISHLHLIAGWHVEKEALRMPSTKNWSVVSTRRVSDAGGQDSSNAQISVLLASALGRWKARDPEQEGKWFLKASEDSHT